MNLNNLVAVKLCSVARQSIEYFLETKQVISFDQIKLTPEESESLSIQTPAFVALYTLTPKGYSLRGVNGVFESFDPLGNLICQLAVNAAFYDPRTPRLRPYELNVLDIHLLIPGVRCKIEGELADVAAVLQKERQGVIAETQGRIAYALPFDWTASMTGEQMVRWLKLQLGISRNSKRSIEYSTFSVKEYVESSVGE